MEVVGSPDNATARNLHCCCGSGHSATASVTLILDVVLACNSEALVLTSTQVDEPAFECFCASMQSVRNNRGTKPMLWHWNDGECGRKKMQFFCFDLCCKEVAIFAEFPVGVEQKDSPPFSQH